MRPEIDQLLTRTSGVASRAQLLTVLSRNELDNEIRRGRLVSPFARAYCRPWDIDEPAVRERAALVSVGAPVALSHLSGLRRWGLTAPDLDDIHVTTSIRRHPIGHSPGLVVHRTRVPTRVRTVNGLSIVEPAVAIVRAWPLMPGADQRAPAIEAVRGGIVTTEDLVRVSSRAIGMPGRRALGQLVGLLDAGCESELEIWGYLDVFSIPGLSHGVRQKVFRIRGKTYRSDLAYEDEQVAVELDGDRYHSTREQRERDRRKDAALASIGWLTLRYSHGRLHGDVAGCRRDTLDTLAARRAWRRSG